MNIRSSKEKQFKERRKYIWIIAKYAGREY